MWLGSWDLQGRLFRAHTAADGLIFPLKEGMGRSPFGKHNFQRDG